MKKKSNQGSHTPRTQKKDKKQHLAAHYASVDDANTLEDSSPLQAKLQTLEQKHCQLNSHYQKQIQELSDILQKQMITKNDLAHQITSLSRLNHQQRDYVQHLKHKFQEQIMTQPSSNKQLVTSAYLLNLPEHGKDEQVRRSSKSRGHLFRSGHISGTLLKQSKSQTDIGSEYFPKMSVRLGENGSRGLFGSGNKIGKIPFNC